jgi:hypothetical protein
MHELISTFRKDVAGVNRATAVAGLKSALPRTGPVVCGVDVYKPISPSAFSIYSANSAHFDQPPGDEKPEWDDSVPQTEASISRHFGWPIARDVPVPAANRP